MIEYLRTSWVNGPGTPLNATNLNNIEQGVVNVTTLANENKSSITELQNINIQQSERLTSAENSINTLQSTVGNSSQGIVKQITDLETRTNTTDTNLSNLEQRVQLIENNEGESSNSVSWSDITGKPSTFTPATHTHSISNISNLTDRLDSKADISHVHSSASATSSGFMTADQYTKLKNIETGANKYVLPDIVNSSVVTASGTTISFSIGNKTFSQEVAVDGGSMSVESATKLTTARTIKLSGDVVGSATFDGSADATIEALVKDDSHNHVIENIDGLQNALALKAETEHEHPEYVNQNAFGEVAVNDTLISATQPRSQIHLVAGNNVTLTADSDSNQITVSSKDTTYSFSNQNPTLSWGKKSTIGSAGGTTYTVTMPSNPNTDTKVTSVENHYAPLSDINSEISIDASSDISATWGTTQLVTGIHLQRDSKGHVTGVTVDSIRMPENPNTDTTYGEAGSSLGLVKTGGDVTITSGIITVNDDSHSHTISNVTGLQDSLDALANMLTWKTF